MSLENPGREVVTVAEASRRLSVHTSTVRAMLDRGDLHRIRIGRAVRVDLASLDRFIAAGGDQPASPAADPIAKEQIRALHAKAAQLARLSGVTPAEMKAKALATAGKHFGREISSTLELTWSEADWLLDVLAGEIKRSS